MKQSDQKILDPVQYKKKYDNYFKNVKQKIQYEPSKKDLQKHRIKIFENYTLMLGKLSYIQPYISIKLIQKQGSIVTYTVVISKFHLQIILLNFEQDAKVNKTNKDLLLGSGAFGQVRIQSSTNRTFAVKRLQFKLKNHFDKELDMKANKIQIEDAIKQFSIYKICSLYKIGPSVDTKIAFDLICYNDCIQFHMQICQKFTQPQIMNEIKYNHHKFKRFKKQIKTAVYLLHSFHIIHKDIKPDNILYSRKYGKFVLSDFGISHPIREDIGYRSKTYKEGTNIYMSMEMVKLKQGEWGYVNLYQNDIHALKLIKPLIKKDNTNKIILKQKIKQNTRKGEFQMSLQISANESIIQQQQQQQTDQIQDKKLQQNSSLRKTPQSTQQEVEEVLSSDHSDCQQSSYQFINNIDFKIQKSTYMYQYLKLKHLALKIWTPQDNIGYYIRQYLIKLSDVHILDILSIVDICMEYQKMKEVYYSLYLNDLQLNNGNIKIIIKSLKHQIDYVGNIKISNNRENVSLSKLKNYTRIYGYSENVMRIIYQMQFRKDFQDFIKKIDKNCKLRKTYNYNKKTQKKFQSINSFLQKQIKIKQIYQRILSMFPIASQQDDIIIYNSLNLTKQYFSFQQKRQQQLQDRSTQIYPSRIIFPEPKIQIIYRQLDIYQNSLGSLNPELILYYNAFGSLFYNLKKYDQALKIYNKSLALVKQIYGQYDLIMVICSTNIGIIYNGLQFFDEAIKCFIKSIKIYMSNRRQEQEILARCYNSLGDTYNQVKDYLRALSNYDKAFNIITMTIQIPDQFNRIIAVYQNNIGNICYLLTYYQQALHHLQESLQINIQIYGQCALSVASNYSCIGNIYIKLNKPQLSLDNYVKCLRIRKIYYLQQEDPQLVNIYKRIIETRFLLKYKYDLTNSNFKKGLKITGKQKSQQISITQIIKSFEIIAMAYSKIKQYKKCLKYLFMLLQIYLKQQQQNPASLFIKIAIKYYKMQKFIDAYLYCQFALENSMDKNQDCLKIIKQLKKIPKIKQYQNEQQFLNNIQKKYMKLKVDKLLEKLRIQKKKLYLKQRYQLNKERISHIYCLIQIIMCYKYLKYTQQIQKSIQNARKLLDSMSCRLFKSIFQEFINQI